MGIAATDGGRYVSDQDDEIDREHIEYLDHLAGRDEEERRAAEHRTFSQRVQDDINAWFSKTYLGGQPVQVATEPSVHTSADLHDALCAGPVAVLCSGPRVQVQAVQAKADDLFDGFAVSPLTYSPDRSRATFHVADDQPQRIQALFRWFEDERAEGRLPDVLLRCVPLGA